MVELVVFIVVVVYIIGFYIYRGFKSGKKKSAMKLRGKYYQQQDIARQFIMRSGNQEAVECYSDLVKRKRLTNKSLRKLAIKKKNKFLAGGFALASGLALWDAIEDSIEDMLEGGDLEALLDNTLLQMGIVDDDFSQFANVTYDGQGFMDNFNPITMADDLGVWQENAELSFADISDSWHDGDLFEGDGDASDGGGGGDE